MNFINQASLVPRPSSHYFFAMDNDTVKGGSAPQQSPISLKPHPLFAEESNLSTSYVTGVVECAEFILVKPQG
jgi:hypothetical protein